MFIEVKDAVKKYGKGEAEVFALNKASLNAEKGEICVILGSSGSGKSTLLNMLGGLDVLDSGSRGRRFDSCHSDHRKPPENGLNAGLLAVLLLRILRFGRYLVVTAAKRYGKLRKITSGRHGFPCLPARCFSVM